MTLDQNHEQCNAVVKGKRGVTDLFLKQLQNLKKDGIQKFESFVTSRILENEDFTKPITKVAIDLFGKTRKKTNKSREMIKCDTSLLQKVFISSYVHGKDALRMFFKHETSAYPFALFSNGNLRSTAKSALLPILESYGFSQSSAPTCDVYVIDGPVLLQMLKPRGSVTTFEEYISKTTIPFVINKAAIYKRVDIVFDVYLRNSIKASIRSKQGSGQ